MKFLALFAAAMSPAVRVIRAIPADAYLVLFDLVAFALVIASRSADSGRVLEGAALLLAFLSGIRAKDAAIKFLTAIGL